MSTKIIEKFLFCVFNKGLSFRLFGIANIENAVGISAKTCLRKYAQAGFPFSYTPVLLPRWVM